MPESVWLIIRGIVAILIGLIAFTWAGITLAVLTSVFAIYALIAGIANLFVGFFGRDRSFAHVLQGVIGIAAAALTVTAMILFAFPGPGAVGVAWLLGGYALAAGIIRVTWGIRLLSHGIGLSHPAHV